MTETIEYDSMRCEVVIVGVGPSGLSAAIKLRQFVEKNGCEINVCVVEGGSEAGAYSLAGAVIGPIALNELIPDWKEKGASLTRAVTQGRMLFLTEKKAFDLPVTPNFDNHGNYTVSLGEVVRWLAEQAKNMGMEIYPGPAAAEVLYHEDGSVKGIVTGNTGIDKGGEPTDSFQPGMELWVQQTLFAEGCHGPLSKQVIGRSQLDQNSQPQAYGLGIKKIREVSSEKHQSGLVVYSAGWPLNSKTYGGAFVCHFDDNKIAVSSVVGLGYQNPYLSLSEELRRFKTHPEVRKTFKGGRRIAYGVCLLIEDGLQSLPKLSFKGGALIGDAAGFLNMSRIKGIHTAMRSAMLVAEAVFPLLENLEEVEGSGSSKEVVDHQQCFEQSWLYQELYVACNIRPSFEWGIYLGSIYTGVDQMIFGGKVPWTLKYHGKDSEQLKKAAACKPTDHPRPDGVLTFDRLSSVLFANLAYEGNQPDHLVLNNPQAMIDVNYKEYVSPGTRYCPAGAHEIVGEKGSPRLQISAANCVHCKTCDIKGPTQNIAWICPEGASGPNYGGMQGEGAI